MSWREHWKPIHSSVVRGDVISGCRDNDSHSYRLFVNKGWKDVRVGKAKGHQFESAECCDLSLENLQELVGILQKAITEHKPWPKYED
jgi:hypothetical protein